jgi:hypothetical protein
MRSASVTATPLFKAFSFTRKASKGSNLTSIHISFYRALAVEAIKAELWSEHHVQLLQTPPDEKLATHSQRTHVCCDVSLAYSLPQVAVESLFQDVIQLLNWFPNNETHQESPKSILTGERLDVSKWTRFKAGDFGHI